MSKCLILNVLGVVSSTCFFVGSAILLWQHRCEAATALTVFGWLGSVAVCKALQFGIKGKAFDGQIVEVGWHDDE